MVIKNELPEDNNKHIGIIQELAPASYQYYFWIQNTGGFDKRFFNTLVKSGEGKVIYGVLPQLGFPVANNVTPSGIDGKSVREIFLDLYTGRKDITNIKCLLDMDNPFSIKPKDSTLATFKATADGTPITYQNGSSIYLRNLTLRAFRNSYFDFLFSRKDSLQAVLNGVKFNILCIYGDESSHEVYVNNYFNENTNVEVDGSIRTSIAGSLLEFNKKYGINGSIPIHKAEFFTGRLETIPNFVDTQENLFEYNFIGNHSTIYGSQNFN